MNRLIYEVPAMFGYLTSYFPVRCLISITIHPTDEEMKPQEDDRCIHPEFATPWTCRSLSDSPCSLFWWLQLSSHLLEPPSHRASRLWRHNLSPPESSFSPDFTRE